MPLPTTQQNSLPRNDSFSTTDIHNAFKAAETKPRNNLSLRVVQHDDAATTAPPPPSRNQSRRSSVYARSEQDRR
ncbi:hypothetical protein LTR53_003787 [Teratosphaeriaceae sp. CCFEE 6253]|nr:hypothetical protein LTR53_003787 [Teratosphaeriaceae sp. CCFEE 6253]